jgi:hypothetical protein
MDISSRFHTFWTVWLLVLVLSPFTAPFSTCAIADLFARDGDRVNAMLVPPLSPEAGVAADAKATLESASTVWVSPLAVVGLRRRLAPPPRAGAQGLLFTVIRV